jgi:hypothetical protein
MNIFWLPVTLNLALTLKISSQYPTNDLQVGIMKTRPIQSAWWLFLLWETKAMGWAPPPPRSTFFLRSIATTTRISMTPTLDCDDRRKEKVGAGLAPLSAIVAPKMGPFTYTSSVVGRLALFTLSILPTAVRAETEIELADLPPPWIPVVFGLGLIAVRFSCRSSLECRIGAQSPTAGIYRYSTTPIVSYFSQFPFSYCLYAAGRRSLDGKSRRRNQRRGAAGHAIRSAGQEGN